VITRALTSQSCPSVCAGQLVEGHSSIQGQDSWEMGSMGMEAGLLHYQRVVEKGYRRGRQKL